MKSENVLLIIFALATPIIVALIRYWLRRAGVAVLKNLSALILTGVVTAIFATIATAVTHDFMSNTARLTNVAIDFCLIFTLAHWLYKTVKTLYDKRAR